MKPEPRTHFVCHLSSVVRPLTSTIIPFFHYSSIPDFPLERETGLEPATTTLATWGSTN
jgi:hypothetical protein